MVCWLGSDIWIRGNSVNNVMVVALVCECAAFGKREIL